MNTNTKPTVMRSLKGFRTQTLESFPQATVGGTIAHENGDVAQIALVAVCGFSSRNSTKAADLPESGRSALQDPIFRREQK